MNLLINLTICQIKRDGYNFHREKTLDIGIDRGGIWSFSDVKDVVSTKSTSILDHHDTTLK